MNKKWIYSLIFMILLIMGTYQMYRIIDGNNYVSVEIHFETSYNDEFVKKYELSDALLKDDKIYVGSVKKKYIEELKKDRKVRSVNVLEGLKDA